MLFTRFKTSLLILLLFILSACVHTIPKKQQTEIRDIVAEANQGFYLDNRIWFQNVYTEFNDSTIVLKGEAFFKIPIRGISKKLRQAGFDFEVIDSIFYLPEPFENDLAYGIVTAPYTMGRYKPVTKKHEGTEILYGEPVRLIRDAGELVQVQSPVGYLGYIPKSDLRTMTLSEWNRYHHGSQAVFLSNRVLENGLTVKLGTRLPYLGEDQVLLADGSIIKVSQDNYMIVDPANNPLRASIISAAKHYLGLPYVWGGRSADGVDCSGFVMQAYSLNNIYLPRDTDEMANIGRIIGFPGWTDALLPGDLLFFAGTRRLVTHTGIYMGDGKVIHSLGSGVQVQSMNPDDPNYAASLVRRFIFAKRIFE